MDRKKSLGADVFYCEQVQVHECVEAKDRDQRSLELLVRGHLFQKLFAFMNEVFNGTASIPLYMREAKAVLLSKTGLPVVAPDDVRTITAYGGVTKIFEAALLAAFENTLLKATDRTSYFFSTPNYQMGFKVGLSTEHPTTQLLNWI
jgi:hypothetical protein